MRNVFLLLLIVGVSLSCRKRLDSFLFNPSQIESYQLDAYQGELTLDLGGQFNVPDSLIHQMQWNVELAEGSAQMSAIYVGDINRIASDTIILYCHGNKRPYGLLLAQTKIVRQHWRPRTLRRTHV